MNTNQDQNSSTQHQSNNKSKPQPQTSKRNAPTSSSSRGNNNNSKSDKSDNKGPLSGTQLSKTMTKILRHQADKYRIPIRSDGYVLVNDLLNHQLFRGVTLDTIQQLVTTCPKQRFSLVQLPVDTNDDAEQKLEWFIRANQGHSFAVPDLELKRIVDASEAPVCIHGTYHKSWKLIKESGLSRMGREHIHFAIGVPADSEVISGMRTSAQVIIHMDVSKMLADGIPLYQSANKVLLSPGMGDTGAIPTRYFAKVVDVARNALLPTE